jgi:polysaccharide export outer membrane protein
MQECRSQAGTGAGFGDSSVQTAAVSLAIDCRLLYKDPPMNRSSASNIQFNRSFATSAFVAAAALLCSGCETTPSKPLASEAEPPARVTLASGDVIKLTFPGATDLNQSQKIQADGKINLPMIGEVDAAGKNIGSLQNELALRYKPQLKDTTVVVTLESSVINVVVSGAVSKPAKIAFDRPTTVLQAIMEAGGPTEYGSLGNVHLIRLVKGEEHTQKLDLRSTTKGQTTKAFYVRNGDVIYLPQSPF